MHWPNTSRLQRLIDVPLLHEGKIIKDSVILWDFLNIRFISGRELLFMFAICRRPSVCLSSDMFAICRRPSVCLSSVCRLSVTFVHPTQPIEILGNISAPFNMLVTWRHPSKILRRSSQGNPSVGGLNQKVVEKCSGFGPFWSYISETVQDRR